jgi:hypothetical protein
MWNRSRRKVKTGFVMGSLPIDVLCLILEQCEVSLWLLQLRAVSRAWRRAVERVAAKALPLGLCLNTQRCSAVMTHVSLPEGDWATSSCVPVGCGVFFMNGSFLRLEGSSMTEIATEPTRHRSIWCAGHGYALSVIEGGACGWLEQFRGGERVACDPVPDDVIAAVRTRELEEMAPDGSLWSSVLQHGANVVSVTARRTDLRSGAVGEGRRWEKAVGRGQLRGWRVSRGRYVNVLLGERQQRVFERQDMATGEQSRFEVPAEMSTGGQNTDFVAVRCGDDEPLSLFDFAFNRVVQLRFPHSLSAAQFAAVRFHSVSDLLVVVISRGNGPINDYCDVFSRRNGRLMWSFDQPEISCVAFCGPSMLLFTANGVLKVDWVKDVGA